MTITLPITFGKPKVHIRFLVSKVFAPGGYIGVEVNGKAYATLKHVPQSVWTRHHPLSTREPDMTGKYEFQGTVYKTESDMLLAIASEFLSQNGKHSEEQQRDTLNEFTDEEHATECIFGLGLNKPTLEDHGQTWLEARGLDHSDIEAAFYDIRARF